jgi:gamma-glutamyltranspeptidase/glutathione hydrolase
MVLGTPGGDTIASTLLEVLSNLVDYAMTLPAAIDAPRFHQSFWPDRARYETSHPLSVPVRRGLEKIGHFWNSNSAKQGHANCVLLNREMALGYADPREGGLALAARTPRNLTH